MAEIAMEATQDVLFEELKGKDGKLGIITLNRPKSLNALNLAMFRAMDEQLHSWDKNNDIKAVIVKAVDGRAFCAGGDIRAVYEAKKKNESHLGDFFEEEYKLDARIFHFSKPYIALMDGITMGGGVGISIHASHRVATENFVFAMPETAIGFYPDVSATYFLPRLPGKVGYYIGLTGERVPFNDCYDLGIINSVVNKESFSQIISDIAETSLNSQAKKTVSEIIDKYKITVPKGTLIEKRTAIDLCFSKSTVEEIQETLTRYPDAWTSTLASSFLSKSPTSLKVTLRQLQTGENLNFDQAMKLEAEITRKFLQGEDFFEGIRAAIIDKDYKPRWKPAKLEEVKPATVDEYFSSLEQKPN